MTTTADEPLLQTLSPALRALEKTTQQWLAAPHHYSLSILTRANLEGLCEDLRRKAEALEMEKPLLVIMLMGGTGVGKSTLLNALAGKSIAQASFVRPTTRDPIVYYHESIQPHRLDLALRHCRLTAHDRRTLEQKIIVDTPDLDSNDPSNREKLLRLLPVADIVLYVGSQEKYHDRLGWELFRQQRQRRAFAFILNKWDRCAAVRETGLRPDEDLLRDLQKEGFENPLLFRVCAQHWVDQATGNGQATPLPEGEQYQELVHWLEMGLTRLEIEAIKARGVSQLLQQLQNALQSATPPDLTEAAAQTRQHWLRQLGEEANADAEVLLHTLEPHQEAIEQDFALQQRSQFRGLMAGYLHVVHKLKYLGSSLCWLLGMVVPEKEKGSTWSLSSIAHTLSRQAAERSLDARIRALTNRLLVEADKHGFPVNLLEESAGKAAKADWREIYAQGMIDVLTAVEQEWAKPRGLRGLGRRVILLLCDWVPLLLLVAAAAVPLWRYFYDSQMPDLVHFLLPLVVLVLVLMLLHVLIKVFLPFRWEAIRGEFERRLGQRLRTDMERIFAAVPGNVVEVLQGERRRVEEILKEVREVAGWLEQREQAASILGLYGK